MELRRGVDYGGARAFDILRLWGDERGAGGIDVEGWRRKILGREVIIDFSGVGRYDRGQLGDCCSSHGCKCAETGWWSSQSRGSMRGEETASRSGRDMMYSVQ